MTKKAVTKRGWSLEKFTKSVTAQAKRLEIKVGNAAQIKQAYDDSACDRLSHRSKQNNHLDKEARG